MNLTKNKNLMLGVGAVVLIAAGYFIFFGGSATPPDITIGTTASPAELLFINLAGELDPISFNGAVFSDSRFAALTDIRTAVVPETPGRLDPFAPFTGAPAAKKTP